MKRVVAALLLALASAVTAQQTTNNLLSGTWSGAAVYTGTGAGFSGGNVAGYNSSTNTIYFGYSQSTVSQTIAINNALSGSGVQVSGINYGFSYLNEGTSAGTLSSTIRITSNTGATLQTYTQSHGTTSGWTAYARTQTFASPYDLANVGNASMSFTGKDNRFWAGYYGPRVSNPYMTLNYTVDPCVGNPRYSSSCPGYNVDMWSTGDLTSVNGTTFAINQALGFGNTGVRVHSVTWGYDYSIGGRWCSGWNFLGICFNWSDSSVTGNVVVNNNNNQVIVSDNNTTAGENISGSFRREVLLGNTSPNVSGLGNASIGLSTTGIASATPYMGFNFTPDICTTDPLVNAQCPGYAAALFTQQCNANQLSDPQCPGYAQAYMSQQCSLNTLYNPACPGYAVAYLNYQCSINPLYATQCPGYAQAYFNQQCTNDPLYSNQCPGYAQAYFNQQCNLNGLYSQQCPNYGEAYAKKNLLNQPVAATTTSTAPLAESTPSTITSATGDATVDKAIVAPTTTATPASPTAAVQLVQAPSTTTPETVTTREKKTETTTVSQASSSEKTQPTARQQLAERRMEAAKREAVEKGKNLANDMGKAADMESQKQIQNIVIEAMGYTPGFDAYSKALVPDAVGYKPFTIYNNQTTVDNQRVGRGLFGPADRIHTELVESQYNRGK